MQKCVTLVESDLEESCKISSYLKNLARYNRARALQSLVQGLHLLPCLDSISPAQAMTTKLVADLTRVSRKRGQQQEDEAADEEGSSSESDGGRAAIKKSEALARPAAQRV